MGQDVKIYCTHCEVKERENELNNNYKHVDQSTHDFPLTFCCLLDSSELHSSSISSILDIIHPIYISIPNKKVLLLSAIYLESMLLSIMEAYPFYQRLH